MACKHILQLRRFSLYILIALLFVSTSVTAGLAAPPPDPYADAVHSSTSGLIISPGNALGAPDGNLATVVGVLGQNLVLDMGEGEEGTSDLIVYYGPLGAGVVASIQFLDADQQVIYSASLLLSANVGGAQVQVTYPDAPTPYRFVRFTSVLSAYTIDAVEAATYRPDSDNDGLPDTWEIQYGLDPLDPAGDNGAAGDPDNDGLTNQQEWTAGTNPTNPDSDGDGLPDGWEVQYGLDPLDPASDNGAAGDPDNDGRTNLEEYLAGTNPVEFDGALFLPLILRE